LSYECMTIKLHLGCGDEYKPGYVNIDRYDRSVADIVSDVIQLPFESSTIDEIEADQLIEHLDYVHGTYALSEWFRVLKPGGRLVLETPDLKASMKEFASADLDSKRNRLHWIYGLDSPGLIHKSGYTFDLLKDDLGTLGFVNISKLDPVTHAYEKGMRIECEKGNPSAKQLLNSALRTELWRQLGYEDSFLLVPLEGHIRGILAIADMSHPASTDLILARLAAVNPRAATAFLDACHGTGMIDDEGSASRNAHLKHLLAMDITGRAAAAWIRSRKGIDLEEEFLRFTARIERLILGELRGESTPMIDFAYMSTLEPEPIELLDFSIIMVEARERFNRGVKAFASGSLQEAESLLVQSVGIDPNNFRALWNLARLAMLRGEEIKALDLLGEALEHAEGKWRKTIAMEMARVKNGDMTLPSVPVSEH
jgi:hypothetical protein